MKPFRFSLEAVRVLRRRQEQSALEEYGRMVWKRQQAALALQAAEHKLESTWLLSRQALNDGSSACHVSQLRDYCHTLEINVQTCRRELNAAESGVATAWQRLLIARQELEAVEKLHEQRRAEHDRELQREEQKLLDEMALRTRAAAVAWEPAAETVWN